MQYKTIKKNRLYGLINIKNEVIIPCKYKEIILHYFEKTGLIEVKDKNGLCGLINIKDEIIIPCEYNYINLHHFKEAELIEIKNENGLWGLINIKNEVIIPCKYKGISLEYFKDLELIEIGINGYRNKNILCSMINIKDEVIIPPILDLFANIKMINNYYLAKNELLNKYCLYNKQGKVILYNKKKIYAI